MDRNHLHFAIEPGTSDWFALNLGLLAAAIILIIASYAWKHPEKRFLIGKIVAIIVAANFFLQSYLLLAERNLGYSKQSPFSFMFDVRTNCDRNAVDTFSNLV